MLEVGHAAGGVELSRTFTGQNSKVRCVSYCGKQVLSGSDDGSILVWNLKPQHRAYRLRGHKGAVWSLDLAKNSEIFASGSADHTVRLWKPSIRGQHLEFKAHAGGVLGVKFSQDSKLLATCGTDKMLKLWDVSKLSGPRPKFLWCIHGHRNWVRATDISKDSFRICSGGDDKMVKVWDMQSAASVATFEDHTANVRTVKFDPLSGVCVASAGEDGTINLWDVRSQLVVQHYALKNPCCIHAVQFHPSGNYLLSTSQDAGIRVWDLREGRLLYTVSAHTKSVNACSFSEDGKHFITGSDDGLVLAWNSESLCENWLQEEQIDHQTVNENNTVLSSPPRRRKSSRHRSHSKRRDSSKVGDPHHHHHHHRHKTKDEVDDNSEEESREKNKSRRRKRSSTKDSKRHHRSKSKSRDRKRSTSSSTRRRKSSAVRSSTEKALRQIERIEEELSREGVLREKTSGEDNDEDTNPSANEEGESGIGGGFGKFTKAAIQAAIHRRKVGSESDASSAVGLSSHNSSQQFETLIRAMQNLEQRLRMNEDAVADLKVGQSQLSESMHSLHLSSN